MIVHWRTLDCAGGLRSDQPAGHALYVARPERLAHAGAVSTCRTRAPARYGRRRVGAAVLLLLTALVLAVLFGARPAAGAAADAPRRPMCPHGWQYKLTLRTIGTHIVIQHMCIRSVKQ